MYNIKIYRSASQTIRVLRISNIITWLSVKSTICFAEGGIEDDIKNKRPRIENRSSIQRKGDCINRSRCGEKKVSESVNLMKPIFKGRKENLHSLKSRRKTARVTKYNRNKKIPVSTSQTLDEKVMGFLNSVIKTYGKDSAVKIKIPSLSNTSKQRKRKLLKSVRWVFFE